MPTKVCLVKSMAFPRSHVWICELDYKESWALKNWCFWTVVLEKILESTLDSKGIQPMTPKGNQSWIFIGRTDAEAETPILWPPDEKNWLIGKDPDAGKDWRREEKGTTEDEMVGWHHWLDGHEFEQPPGVGDGQGNLACWQSIGLQVVRHDWATELKLRKASQDNHRGLTWAGPVLWAACGPWRLPRWLQPLRLMWQGLQGILAQRIFKNLTIGSSLDGKGVQGRRDTCICMAESLHCSPETVTILLIGYTPIQNKKFKLKKNFF